MTEAEIVLINRLKKALNELEKVAQTIDKSKGLAQESEVIMCMREIILEQLGIPNGEGALHSTSPNR